MRHPTIRAHPGKDAAPATIERTAARSAWNEAQRESEHPFHDWCKEHPVNRCRRCPAEIAGSLRPGRSVSLPRHEGCRPACRPGRDQRAPCRPCGGADNGKPRSRTRNCGTRGRSRRQGRLPHRACPPNRKPHGFALCVDGCAPAATMSVGLPMGIGCLRRIGHFHCRSIGSCTRATMGAETLSEGRYGVAEVVQLAEATAA